MGRSRKEIIEKFPEMEIMYNSGYTVSEIARSFGVSKDSVYNWFNIMGYSLKKRVIDEDNIIYAINNPPVLEKVLI